IAVKPGGGEVWVTNRSAHNVSIVSEETLEVVATLACPGFPIRLKFTPDGKRALVSCAFAGEVAVFDVKARKLVKRIKMARPEGEKEKDRGNMFRRRGPMPIGIVIPKDGKQAFVACGNHDALVVIDLQTLEVIARFKTGREPDGLAYSPR
ncbi:MAG: gluconolaconase, partial [Gammaproteobacteria bacterium]|nr:gluconolaconase [Gammaproteobacteria bacterium]